MEPMLPPAGRPFRLTAIFTAVSLLAIGAATAVVMALISRQERQILLARSETSAAQVADHLNAAIHDQFLFPLQEEGRAEDLRDPGQYARLDHAVRDAVQAFQVERVLLFDTSARVVYSTDPALLGRALPGHKSILAALAGRTEAELKRRGSLLDLGGTPAARDLIEVYIPARRLDRLTGKPGEIRGVLEIYQDGTPLMRAIAAARAKVAWITAAAMGGLFGLLFFVVRRADGILKRQNEEIRRNAETLEETVRSRTQALLQAQDQLIEAAKLASVGTLAAGVAHEINNPLASVAACAEGLLARAEGASFREAPDFAEFPEYLRIIRKEAFRCKEVTGKLLDFARQRPAQRIPVELDAVVEDIRLLLSHEPLVRQGRLALFLNGQRAMGDPGQVRQVVLNLVRNALDAVRDRPGGRVEIETLADGPWAVLVVKDNGVGFTEEERRHLFDPFFTTKPPGQGTGLGLALSHAIAERHGGRVSAESPGRGRGATFRLVLPSAEAA